MAVVAMAVPLIGAQFTLDPQRNPKHHPGAVVYSAQFDREKLVCLYKILTFPWCCGLEEMAANTSYDVYTNGVMFTSPYFIPNGPDCCCGRPPLGRFRYYDHPVFTLPVTGGTICRGTMYGCCAVAGCFGDAVNHYNRLHHTCEPSLLGHLILHECCQTAEQVYGLKEGESGRVAGIVNERVRAFRENPAFGQVQQAYAPQKENDML